MSNGARACMLLLRPNPAMRLLLLIGGTGTAEISIFLIEETTEKRKTKSKC